MSQPKFVQKEDAAPGECYFLRVRTRTDNEGNIISANYAKICKTTPTEEGYCLDWHPTGEIRFTYYFNPTPNDRNLEFDPKRNLYKTKSGEEVPDP